MNNPDFEAIEDSCLSINEDPRENLLGNPIEKLKENGSENQKGNENVFFESSGKQGESHHDHHNHDEHHGSKLSFKSLMMEDLPLRYKSFGMLSLMTLSATMGSAFFGFNQTVFGTLLDPWLQEVFKIKEGSDENVFVSSLFNASHCLGTIFGSYLCGMITTSLGRRGAFISCDLTAILSQLLYQIPIIEVAFFARFLCGFFVGFNSCAVIMYLNEMIPMERAGVFVNMNQVMINVMILGAYGFSLGEVPTMGNYWRIVLIMPVFFCLFRLFCLLVIFKHDTPNYLYLVKDDRDAAEMCVRDIYLPEYVDQRMHELDNEKKLVGQANTLGQLWKSKAMRKRIIYGMILMYCQQLVGVNSVFFYASEVFSKASIDPKTGKENHTLDSIYSILLAILNLIYALFVGYVIDKFGRRKPLLGGLTVNVLTLIGIGYAFQTEHYKLVPIFFYLYIFGFNFGMGAVAWVAICEIVPNQGVHLAIMANWAGDLTITATFKYLVILLTEQGTFYLFAFNAVWTIVFVIFCIVETRGKSEVDVAIEYGEDPDKAKETAQGVVRGKAGH